MNLIKNEKPQNADISNTNDYDIAHVIKKKKNSKFHNTQHLLIKKMKHTRNVDGTSSDDFEGKL